MSCTLSRRVRSRGRGIARADVVSFASFGAAVLALAVPTVWVSRVRMAALSAAAPLARATAPRSGSGRAAPGMDASALAAELRRLRARVIQLEEDKRRLAEELRKGRGFAAARREARLDAGRFIEALVLAGCSSAAAAIGVMADFLDID